MVVKGREGERSHIGDNQEDIVPAKGPFDQPGADEDTDPDGDGSEDGEEDKKGDALVMITHGWVMKCSLFQNDRVRRANRRFSTRQNTVADVSQYIILQSDDSHTLYIYIYIYLSGRPSENSAVQLPENTTPSRHV